jgi:hypothetical protein
MKNKAIFSALLFVLLSSSPEFADLWVRASGPPLFQQAQQGLSPDRKKSLAGIGPDEIFPENTPSETNKKTNREPDRSRQATKPLPAPAPVVRPTVKPPIIPVAASANAPVVEPEAVASSSTSDPIPVVARQRATSAPVSSWTLFTMSLLTLVIFVGLIYVLQKLKEKLLTSNSR